MSTDPTPIDQPDLPDLTDVIIADMVEGVKRYLGFADEALKSAAEYRRIATEQDAAVIEYEAKAAALSAVLVRLGYDPETGNHAEA